MSTQRMLMELLEWSGQGSIFQTLAGFGCCDMPVRHNLCLAQRVTSSASMLNQMDSFGWRSPGLAFKAAKIDEPWSQAARPSDQHLSA